MKKVFLHTYSEQNLGDDMFVKYICDRYQHVEFYIVCKAPFKRAFLNISNLIIFSTNDFLKDTNFDLQIFIGGSIFMQSNNKGVYKKYHIDCKRRLDNIPTYIIGANFGPYSSKLFLFLYKSFFKKSEQVVFRDEYSYRLFDLKNMNWAPDILFKYQLPNVIHKKEVAISCIKKNNRSGLRNFDEGLYFKKMSYIAEEYAKRNYSINLTCFSKVQEDDVAAKIIYNLLSPATKSVTEVSIYQGNIDSFLKNFLSSSYIIATRFHSAILGWNAGIPFFPVCYNDKFNNALDSYDFKGNIINIDKLDEVDFSFIDYNRKSFSNSNINFLKSKANSHFSTIDKILKE